MTDDHVPENLRLRVEEIMVALKVSKAEALEMAGFELTGQVDVLWGAEQVGDEFEELVALYMSRGATRSEAEQAATFALDGPDDFAQ